MEKKTRNQILAGVGLLLVLCLAVGGGIYYWWTSSKVAVYDDAYAQAVCDPRAVDSLDPNTGVVKCAQWGPETKESEVEPPEVSLSQPMTVTAGITNTAEVDGWGHLDEEFHISGDHQDVANVDHDGEVRVTISWFWAAAGTTPPEEACTAHVTTGPLGERVTYKGAQRTWEWVGSDQPSKEDVYALVGYWIGVLEEEPRGSCAHDGAYSVSWQNTSLDPGGSGRPPMVVSPRVDETVLYAQTDVNIRSQPEIPDDDEVEDNVVGVLRMGEKVVVVETQGRWVRHSEGWSAKTGNGMILLASEPPVDIEPDVAGPDEWVEMEDKFHPTGGEIQTWTLNHEEDPNRVSIAWFWARKASDPVPENGFTAVAYVGAGSLEVMAAGGSRTWRWTGSVTPTEEQVQAQIGAWMKVLEEEAGQSYAVVTFRDP